MKKKFLALLVVFTIFCQNITTAYALTDNSILLDPIANMYSGTSEAAEIIRNVSFRDVPASHWAKEAITRMATVGILKGDGAGGSFRPEGNLSNQEAIAFIIRMLGMDQRALDQGAALQQMYPEGTDSRQLWAAGYIDVASQLGLVTANDLADALTYDQSQLDPTVSFMREYPVTRERVCEWVSKALVNYNQYGYVLPTEYTKVKNFVDWASIDVTRIQHVEGLLNNGIISGMTETNFAPKGRVTRAQMAQILKNIDTIYFDVREMEKKSGTVATIQSNIGATTGSNQYNRSIYIRTADGKSDVINFTATADTMGRGTYDAVVCNLGTVAGLNSLAEGDEIEYIVDRNASEGVKNIYYVHKTKGYTETKMTGRLQHINVENNQITILNQNGTTTTLTLAQGMLRTDGTVTSLIIDGIHPQDVTKIPIGSSYEVTLANDIVKFLKFLGQPVLENEIGGVVVENNPAMGYITIFGSNGQKITKQYYESDMLVKKLEYYESSDDIGYIAKMFPNFKFNPAIQTIDKIEPGDVVSIQLDKSDSNIISTISASTNYAARYGKILQIDTTSEIYKVLLEGENKQTGWYDIAPGAAITKEGRMANINTLQAGDWAKLLVNQAIMEPGYFIESVKAVAIEGDAHNISSVVKGEIGSIDEVQKRISLTNYQELTKTGWTNNQDLKRLDVSGKDMQIYMDGQKISLDYALNYLKRGGAEAYVALENNYAGEKVKKITFRTERDEVLSPDTVVYSGGDGSFLLGNSFSNIRSDEGTIVVRNGRLVNASNIMVPDYANVVINGENRAAVVSIGEAPGVSAPLVFRVRVQSVDEGKTITASSISILAGTAWSPTPIQRVFEIDSNTKYYDDSGRKEISQLIDYGPAAESAYNKVYIILADGARADWIFEMTPFPRYSVRGTVYEASGGSVLLKDVTAYNPDTGAWTDKGREATVSLTVPENGAVIKSNRVGATNDIRVGDQLRIMTATEIPNVMGSGFGVTGQIVYVEN